MEMKNEETKTLEPRRDEGAKRSRTNRGMGLGALAKVTDADVIERTTETLEVGPMTAYLNMIVFPLLGPPEERGPRYLTMTEALAGDFLEVTEVDHGGSVPYLRVRNLSPENVLLLDGEELAGAKQNRVLNTTVLVAAGVEAVVPVSCTERGRWSYNTHKFLDSKLLMAKKARSNKSKSVSNSLKLNADFCSYQSMVWEDIDAYHAAYGSVSSTSAMKDVYEQREREFAGYREAFPCLDGQRGLAVFVNGSFSGWEVVSRSRAYAQVHRKIVESHAVDACLERKASSEVPSEEKALSLVREIPSWNSERFKSVGLGDDVRLSRRDSHGNALLVDQSVVHLTVFGPQSQSRSFHDADEEL